MVPIIMFVGKHNSGKTTLLTQIINRLENQGIRTGVIKGARQNLDLPSNKDGEKLFNAGASVVLTSGLDIQIAYWRNKVSLDELIEAMDPDLDLIIIEGFKEAPYPKIEIIRQDISEELLDISNVIARVTDFNLNNDDDTKTFKFEEIEQILDFIIHRIKLN